MRWFTILLILLTLTSYNYPDYLYYASLPEVVVTARQEVPKDKQDEWLLLARLITAEAGNQPFDGQHAVADVVCFISKEKGWSITRTVYDKGRFDGVHSKHFYTKPSNAAKEAARLAILGRHILPYGVFYFHNPKISTDTKWTRYIEQYKYRDYGEHRFCYSPKYYPT